MPTVTTERRGATRDLEEPADAIVIDVVVEPPAAVRQILSALSPARAKAS